MLLTTLYTHPKKNLKFEFVIIHVGCFSLFLGGSHVVQADPSLAMQARMTLTLDDHFLSMSVTLEVHALATTCDPCSSMCLI